MNNCSLNSHGPHDLNTVPDEKQYKISFQRLAYKLTRVQIRPYIKSSSYINKKVATEWLNFEILEPSA